MLITDFGKSLCYVCLPVLDEFSIELSIIVAISNSKKIINQM